MAVSKSSRHFRYSVWQDWFMGWHICSGIVFEVGMNESPYFVFKHGIGLKKGHEISGN